MVTDEEGCGRAALGCLVCFECALAILVDVVEGLELELAAHHPCNLRHIGIL